MTSIMETQVPSRPSAASETVRRVTVASRLIEAAEGDKDGAPIGRVSALVSAFDVKYKIGFELWHTIKPGAFEEGVLDIKPFYCDHDWGYGTPPFGDHTSEETDEGLVIHADLYVEDPTVARLYRSIKSGAVKEYSIGYEPTAIEVDPDDENHELVTKLIHLESSSVLRGANPNTRTIKAAAPAQSDVDRLVEAIKAGVFDEHLAARVAAIVEVDEVLEAAQQAEVSLGDLVRFCNI